MTAKPISITGQLYYASDMVQFNQYTEASKKYLVKLGNLSAEDVAKVEALGVNVSSNEAMGRYVTCKSNFVHKPVDDEGNEVDPKTIGNGSKATLIASPYPWSFAKKKGFALSAVRLVVTELVTYVPSAKVEEEADMEL